MIMITCRYICPEDIAIHSFSLNHKIEIPGETLYALVLKVRLLSSLEEHGVIVCSLYGDK
jgi:hypothetical protein